MFLSPPSLPFFAICPISSDPSEFWEKFIVTSLGIVSYKEGEIDLCGVTPFKLLGPITSLP